MIASWLVGFCLYEWIAQTQGLGFWSRLPRAPPPADGGIGASLPSFARRRSRSARVARYAFPAVRPLGVIGHLSRDIVAGAAPRIGGGPWYAGRALRLLGDDAVLFAKCGDADRARLQRSLAAIGLPASLSTGGETTAFSFSYDADGTRTMNVDVVGEPWHARRAAGRPPAPRRVAARRAAPAQRLRCGRARAARLRPPAAARRARARARAGDRAAHARRRLRPGPAAARLDPQGRRRRKPTFSSAATGRARRARRPRDRAHARRRAARS